MPELVKPGRYAMFLRKSREDVEAEREGKFETLAKHKAILERYAQDNGLNVVRVYEELVSGASLDTRDVAREMLEDVRACMYDGVLAFDIQRVTRGGMIDQGTIMLAFRLTRTLIVTPQKIYDMRDELDGNYAELEMMFGRMELARITRRLVVGKEEAARQGQYIATYPPFGFDKARDGRMKTLVPNADAPIVRRWYEDIVAGRATSSSIANDLNERGIIGTQGGNWSATTVRQVIHNPVYMGKVRWNRKVTVSTFDGNGQPTKARRKPEEGPILVDALWDGIVSEELWRKANEELSSHAVAPVASNAIMKNPLAGLIVCAKCGKSMRCAKSSRAHGRVYISYTHPKETRTSCWMTGCSQQKVLDALIDALAAIAKDLETSTRGSYATLPQTLTARAEELERQAAGEDRAVENLLRLAEKGLIDDDTFAKRSLAARQRKADAIRSAADAREEALRATSDAERSMRLREAIADLADHKGRAAEVNRALKTMIKRIEYEKDPQTGEIHLGVFLK